MTKFWHFRGIRSRLFLAYLSIILLGFGALTLFIGQQISSSARSDYESQLLNTGRLVAQGIRPFITDEDTSESISDELSQLIADYEADTNIDIRFMRPDNTLNFDDAPNPSENPISRNIIELVDDNGNQRLSTVIPIEQGRRNNDEQERQNDGQGRDNERNSPFIIVSAPYENLNAIILQRWGTLWLIVLLIALLTLIASSWVAQTIIRPVYKLRDTAVRLAQGDFSHRIKVTSNDEIAEVAHAFNEMAQQVESMLEEQKAFASNTSHELRTPLTSIRLRSEALRYEKLDPETEQSYIEDIDNEVIRMTTLIEDLTLLSRFDAKRAELGQSEIDIVRLANSLTQRLETQASAKSIRINFTADEALDPIISSMNHVQIVFRNILDNAIKYTGNDGQIDWDIRPHDKGILSTIRDNGEGIEAENLQHLFERFYRVDQSRSRTIQGTGLGLPLVKSILDAYGAWIKIESEGKNKGTVVTIYIPSRTENRL
ncbi:MAG: hypothetical protein Phog2KO_07760 [Phototrophicaceae bacterium]